MLVDELIRTEEFYEAIAGFTESSTLVDVSEDISSYYYDAGHCGKVWILERSGAYVVAYCFNEDLPKLRSRGRVWMSAVAAGEAPAGSLLQIGAPQYGALRDTETGQLAVVWALGGDWIGIVTREFPARRDALPEGWEESYRARIIELALQRAPGAGSRGS